MDQVYPFSIASSAPIHINPRTSLAGILELHVVTTEHSPLVYLFLGEMSEIEVKEGIAFKPIPTWSLAANPFAPATAYGTVTKPHSLLLETIAQKDLFAL